MRKTACGFAALCLALSLLLTAKIVSAEELKTYKNSIGMELVLIPAGSFIMGNAQGYDDEKPEHTVTISQPFYLGKYEVTQAQWEAVMGSNPSQFDGSDNPVERVSWNDAQEFIRRLNAREGHNRYRLPTEAEWEHAARAGTNEAYFFGNDAGELGRYAWYDGNSGEIPHPVGQKPANPWGLYDIYGNVYEWVGDWYGDYAASPAADPRGPADGSIRVFRGGSWHDTAGDCRSAFRFYITPVTRFVNLGFRLALSPE